MEAGTVRLLGGYVTNFQRLYRVMFNKKSSVSSCSSGWWKVGEAVKGATSSILATRSLSNEEETINCSFS